VLRKGVSAKLLSHLKPLCVARRYCVEYDLAASTVATGVVCVKSMHPSAATVCSHRIELAAKPTAVMWHPKINGDFEDRFVVANDAFKLKEFNLDSKQCRRTSLAPRFGNPPIALVPVPPPPVVEAPVEAEAPAPLYADQQQQDQQHHDQQQQQAPETEVPQTEGVAEAKAGEAGPEEAAERPQSAGDDAAAEEPTKFPPVPEYFAFSTGNRVVGISSFPLTGDPSQVT
jgi:hypothetical protein